MINYSDASILSKMRDEEKSKSFFDSLSVDDIKRILLYVNSKVRHIPIEENDFFYGMSYAGGLVPPNSDIKNRYFEKILVTLKKVKNNRDRGTMLYYLINGLHLFEDGNGRTARAIFQILNDANFSFEDNDTLIHDKEFDKAIVGPDKFQENCKIVGSSIAELCSNCFLYKSLIEAGILPNTEFYTKKCLLNTDVVEKGVSDNNIFVSDDVMQSISSSQYHQIQDALANNNCPLGITTSGMVMLLMMQNGFIGELDKYEFLGGYALSFSVGNYSKNDILSKLKREDYFRIVDIANILKEDMLDMILDFFEHSDNFKFYDGITMKEILTNGNIKQMIINIGGLDTTPAFLNVYEISKFISKNATVDIVGTRTEKNMYFLSNYIRNMCLN